MKHNPLKDSPIILFGRGGGAARVVGKDDTSRMAAKFGKKYSKHALGKPMRAGLVLKRGNGPA